MNVKRGTARSTAQGEDAAAARQGGRGAGACCGNGGALKPSDVGGRPIPRGDCAGFPFLSPCALWTRGCGLVVGGRDCRWKAGWRSARGSHGVGRGRPKTNVAPKSVNALFFLVVWEKTSSVPVLTLWLNWMSTKYDRDLSRFPHVSPCWDLY